MRVFENTKRSVRFTSLSVHLYVDLGRCADDRRLIVNSEHQPCAVRATTVTARLLLALEHVMYYRVKHARLVVHDSRHVFEKRKKPIGSVEKKKK